MHTLLWFGAFNMKKISNLDFLSQGKKVTSLAVVLVKIIYWHKNFYLLAESKIYATLFKSFGMQNIDMVIFFLRCFRKE